MDKREIMLFLFVIMLLICAAALAEGAAADATISGGDGSGSYSVDSADYEFTLSSTQVQTGQSFQICFFVKDAVHLKVRMAKAENADWSQRREVDGSTGRWDESMSESGTYVFTPIATFENSREVIYASTTLTVTAESDLGPITLNSIPNTVKPNTAITGSFSNVSGAEWYHVKYVYLVESSGEETLLDYEMDADKSRQLNLPATEKTGLYRLWIYAGATNRNASYVEKIILVTDKTVSSDVRLTVEGQSETYTGLAQQKIWFTVTAPGSTAFRVLNANGYWDYFDSRSLADGSYSFWRRYNSGSYAVVAEAAYDGGYNWDGVDTDDFNWENLTWSKCSNTVTMNLTAKGKSAPATAVVPSSVERGERLAVTINSLGSGASRGTRFYCYIRNMDDWHIGAGITGDGTVPQTVYFPTGNMDAGRYYVIVESFADGYDLNAGSAYMFEVTDSGQSTFVFELPDQVYENRAFTISAYEPDASRISLYIKNTADGTEKDIGAYTGHYIYDTNFKMLYGEYDIYAVAHYEGGTTRNSETKHVSCGYIGQIGTGDYSVNSVVKQGDPFIVTINSLQGKDEYYGGGVQGQEPYTDWDECSQKIIISSEGLETGSYKLEVWCSADGYKGNSSVRNVQIVAASEKVFVLPEETTEIGNEAFRGIPNAIFYVPASVTAIPSGAFEPGTRIIRPDGSTQIIE
ncbi:MAG: hypothetical protein IJT77_09330 [Clostridia bacterium]|nr:hypothetical protein [Clostridia bacterium]